MFLYSYGLLLLQIEKSRKGKKMFRESPKFLVLSFFFSFCYFAELDKTLVEAYVGLGLIERNKEETDPKKKKENIKNAMQRFKDGYELRKNCSFILNHLADHYFYSKPSLFCCVDVLTIFLFLFAFHVIM
jgi:hypothetical protein